MNNEKIIKLSKFYIWQLWYVEFDNIGEDVTYKIVRKDNTLFIVFRGSTELNDWKHNFMFWKAFRKQNPYKDMTTKFKVHKGFLHCWKQVEDIVIEKIKDPTIKQIIISGYSHGAGLAVLCHECVWFHRPDLRENNLFGYGFGCPRVIGKFRLNANLKARWKNFKVFRNHLDLVTHLPPKLLGYAHVSKPIKIWNKKHYGPIKSHYELNIVKSLIKYEKENPNEFISIK